MVQLAEGFRDALRRYRIAELEEHAGAIYGLTPDFRLAYMNPAWFRFAEVNGGEPRISTERGDWIPDWVTTSPKAASHGICPTCYRFHYPAETDA